MANTFKQKSDVLKAPPPHAPPDMTSYATNCVIPYSYLPNTNQGVIIPRTVVPYYVVNYIAQCKYRCINVVE